jgi:hypothetical protein
MPASLVQILTSRAAGPIATLLAAALAVALWLNWSAAENTRARLETRIAALDKQLTIAVATQRAQVAACAAGQQAVIAAAGRKPTPAERLMQQPEGFDVCARMESADQAVLDSLGHTRRKP